MQHLSNAIPVWPPVREQTDAVRKCALVGLLDNIAKQTGRMRPRSCLLTAKNPPPTALRRQQWVLKRERSQCTENVILPHEVTKEKIEELLQERYLWLAQEYMPLLRDVGEWRAVMAGGQIQYVIFTTPHEPDMSFVLAENFKSLPHMM